MLTMNIFQYHNHILLCLRLESTTATTIITIIRENDQQPNRDKNVLSKYDEKHWFFDKNRLDKFNQNRSSGLG